MTLTAALTAFCEMLRARTGARVVLGHPDSGVSGMFVWPWMLAENSHLRSQSVLADKSTPRAPPYDVHVLVAAVPALTADGLSILEAARQAILDHPILEVAGASADVTLSPLAAADLAAVFTASGFPLTLCVSAVMRVRP